MRLRWLCLQVLQQSRLWVEGQETTDRFRTICPINKLILPLESSCVILVSTLRVVCHALSRLSSCRKELCWCRKTSCGTIPAVSPVGALFRSGEHLPDMRFLSCWNMSWTCWHSLQAQADSAILGANTAMSASSLGIASVAAEFSKTLASVSVWPAARSLLSLHFNLISCFLCYLCDGPCIFARFCQELIQLTWHWPDIDLIETQVASTFWSTVSAVTSRSEADAAYLEREAAKRAMAGVEANVDTIDAAVSEFKDLQRDFTQDDVTDDIRSQLKALGPRRKTGVPWIVQRSTTQSPSACRRTWHAFAVLHLCRFCWQKSKKCRGHESTFAGSASAEVNSWIRHTKVYWRFGWGGQRNPENSAGKWLASCLGGRRLCFGQSGFPFASEQRGRSWAFAATCNRNCGTSHSVAGNCRQICSRCGEKADSISSHERSSGRDVLGPRSPCIRCVPDRCCYCNACHNCHRAL